MKENLLDDSDEDSTSKVNIEINEQLFQEKDLIDSGSKSSSNSCCKKLLYTIFPYCKKVNTRDKKQYILEILI